jgi:DNA-binding transcriptional ArsR family regulator
MVKYSDRSLNRVYGALSDATRRLILEQLAEQEMAVSELAGPFEISLPAISRHLRVLENAQLLAREKHGRMVQCRLVVSSLQSAAEWLAGYRAFWENRLAALEKYLREEREGARREYHGPRRRKRISRQRHGRVRLAPQAGLDSLDSIFAALADATRRKILSRLMSGSATVTELAGPFDVSLPAVSKHLRVLENAGLLLRENAGRVQSCHLLAGPLQEASAWIWRYAGSC